MHIEWFSQRLRSPWWVAGAACCLAGCGLFRSSTHADSQPGEMEPEMVDPDATSPPSSSGMEPGGTVGGAGLSDEGIAVEDVLIGEGAVVTADSAIVARMVGQLADGTVIHETAEPAGPWPVASLIEGLARGLEGMAEGGARRVTIPAALAYGDEPVLVDGEVLIPPGSMLMYEVELVEVHERDESVEPTEDEEGGSADGSEEG